MIRHKTAINFLRCLFSESVTDIANITVAEAEDDYNTILHYLGNVQNANGKWIEEIKQERDEREVHQATQE